MLAGLRFHILECCCIFLVSLEPLNLNREETRRTTRQPTHSSIHPASPYVVALSLVRIPPAGTVENFEVLDFRYYVRYVGIRPCFSLAAAFQTRFGTALLTLFSFACSSARRRRPRRVSDSCITPPTTRAHPMTGREAEGETPLLPFHLLLPHFISVELETWK